MVFLNFTLVIFIIIFFFFSVGRSPSPLFYIQRLTFTPAKTDTRPAVRELWEKRNVLERGRGETLKRSQFSSVFLFSILPAIGL